MPPIPAPAPDGLPRAALAAMAGRWSKRLKLTLGPTLGLASALILLLTAAHAQPVCRGTDLLPELAKSQPALHARIMEAVRRDPNGEQGNIIQHQQHRNAAWQLREGPP